MAVKIGSETGLEGYLKSFSAGLGIAASEYVDIETDAEELMAAYFRNRYKGPVLFSGIMESRVEMKQSITYSKNLIALTVLVKYDKKNPSSLSAVREQAKQLILRVLHKLRMDWEQTLEKFPKTQGEHWSFELGEGLLLPVGDVANAGCRGWYGEVSIGWPVNAEGQ